MSQEVDELFGSGRGAPNPRVALALALMASGVALAVCGMPCTAVPGGAVALLGWFVVEQDADRLDAGYLPVDARGTVRVLRAVGVVVLVAIVALVFVQLLFSSWYVDFWDRLLQEIAQRIPPPDPPPDPIPPTP